MNRYNVARLLLLVMGLQVMGMTALHESRLRGAVSRIDFEDLPVGTLDRAQLSARGVLLPHGAFVDTDPAAPSGTKVLRAADPSREFHTGPLIVEFTSAQSHIRLLASLTLSSIPLNGTLRAFDTTGTPILQDGPKQVSPRDFSTVFEIRAQEPSIVRIELEIGVAEFEAIDNLEFEGELPGPLPTDPPVVQIISPTNGAQIDTSTVTLEGTVSGSGLLSTASFKLESRLPPDSTAPPPGFSAFPLSGSGASRTFSLPITVGIGPLVITVEAENSAGLRGVATVRVDNLPQSIRTRYEAEGGVTGFGDFQFGGADGTCIIAVYERGAISSPGMGVVTFIVKGDILTKWMALRDQGVSLSRLGCPVGEERASLAGARAQDFTRGRIYTNIPGGTFYVPFPFVEAIDRLGGEAATGLPRGDPRTDFLSSTWLFQRFVRPGQVGLPSTLEISGSPPTLWVQRQGGSLSELASSGLAITASTPTLWERHPCSANQGPCTILTEATFSPLQNAGIRYCNGLTYLPFDPLPGRPPEWVAVVGDYQLTPIAGIVSDSHMAGQDWPQTHENFGDPPLFPSDWNIVIRPFFAYSNLFADNTQTIELEIEHYFVQYFFAGWGYPERGDLIFASGRWIIDCGHSPYNSEIHPPSIMALMRTETFLGRPATVANVWAGGFYTGDPVEFDIFPPPKPSPDAMLTVVQPRGAAEQVTDVLLENNVDPKSHVRLRFTASPRRVPVTDAGEMKWQRGRGYLGRWYVLWNQ